ncbi:MAG TPA: aminodeoxychorismate synthase component I, partial [Coxiellaceae bacterium]|nr:aminodeoxychorismate synthase component I [Coxiellaceae bacterium]
PNFIPEISPISNFTKEQYLETVHKIKNYILQGDIFQANLSQRFSIHQRVKDPIALYSILRQVNPAPFSAFLGYKDYAIASSSPERFLSLRNQQVETRPIKGTAPRSSDSLEDQRLATALQQSPKDRAENSMIVDLMRNDLSRVCEAGTLCVPQWCGLESFETVHHLVSVVQGHLKAEWGPIDLIQSTFPGGSITGAPKVRAMQIIDELEPTCRGPYCGSIGYIGFDESLDLSIAIRTLLIEPNRVTYQTGGAIILDSVAENEYDETLSKAQALQKAINLYFSQEQMHCHDTANR